MTNDCAMPEAAGYDADLIVIGGGSAGLAAAKEAANLGAKVTLFDFVTPTIHGTKWGVGGTCVNVGCIPKKLMHRSARIGHALSHDAKPYGWEVPSATFNWTQMASTVQNYVKQLNFSYKGGLRSAKVTYVNALARLSEDGHTVKYNERGQDKQITGQYILVACGGRPFVPADVPGAREYAITSDDLFWLKKSPGKTLVVGGSYIALECAGFLTEMGMDTTVVVRSILLRGFDRQCAEKIGQSMEEFGCKFLREVTVTRITRPEEGGQLHVQFSNGTEGTYDTVMYATGRVAQAEKLGLQQAGVELTKTGKIICDELERTSCPWIFAVGDTVHSRPELVPTAIRASELLARRLFGPSTATVPLMDYHNVPTTVFTPVEYGCIGVSEEGAIERYGEDDVETFLLEFNPVEVSAAHWHKAESTMADEYDTDVTPVNLSKLVCVKSQDLKVVGFHCIGVNAGEMTQGYAIAIKAGLTKAHFDNTLGIHPTDAESFHTLSITRASGQSFRAAGGCGGGKCG